MSALLSLADDIAADRRISAEEALHLRKEIFPDGVVSRQEAEVLIALNNLVAEADEAWAHAFVEALVDHALRAGPYEGHVDDVTADWLQQTFADTDRRELEAMLKICERAESTPDGFLHFTRTRIAAYVEGRAMDAEHVELIRRALYASGGEGGVAVEHPELAWLFAIDAEGDGRDHHPDWRDLFVKAALCHVVGRRAPAVLEAEVMQARAARFEQRSRVSPFSVFSSLVSGGFSGFWARMRAAGPVEALEQRYEEANAETQADAKLTAGEVAMLLGLSELDGKLTANEQALMDALEALEAEQG